MPTDLREGARWQTSLNPPRMRGLLHMWCVPISIVAGVLLVVFAPTTTARILTGIFALTVTLMFAASAIFHRGRWSESTWWKLRQVDQSAIYGIIAGSYTGIGGLALDEPWRTRMLLIVWIGTFLGILLVWLPFRVPFGLNTAVYMVLGAAILPRLGDLADGVGALGIGLICSALVLYAAGAICLGLRIPNPLPDVFGYHEVWHLVVLIAVILEYSAIIFAVFPKLA